MIYGLNFNGTEIPADMRFLFANQIKLAGMGRGEYAYLKGVATSEEEINAMQIVASNGTRKLHVSECKTAAGSWYALYVY